MGHYKNLREKLSQHMSMLKEMWNPKKKFQMIQAFLKFEGDLCSVFIRAANGEIDPTSEKPVLKQAEEHFSNVHKEFLKLAMHIVQPWVMPAYFTPHETAARTSFLEYFGVFRQDLEKVLAEYKERKAKEKKKGNDKAEKKSKGPTQKPTKASDEKSEGAHKHRK